MPSEDDYNNIDPVTYEGIFYQEQQDFGDFHLQAYGPPDVENDAHTRGETVVNIKDIHMLSKLHANDGNDDEPPTYYSKDSDSDSENENPLNYESDDSR